MISTFDDLYVHELQMLTSAESQTVSVLPKLVKAAETSELKKALEDHLTLCREQLAGLEQQLEELHCKNEHVVCSGMTALLRECVDILSEFPDGNLRDAVMIAYMQRADHYKISAYDSASAFAKLLGFKETSESLAATAKTVTVATRALGAVAIQINAEVYVDTRLDEPLV